MFSTTTVRSRFKLRSVVISKLWLLIFITGVPLAFVYPALAFPMCLQTFPLRKMVSAIYLLLTAVTYWLPWVKWITPTLLLAGCNGAFYIDHLVLSAVLYATLWSTALRTSVTLIIGAYYVRYQFKHDKHVTIF